MWWRGIRRCSCFIMPMPGVRVLGLGPVSGRLDSQVGGWGYDAGSTMGAEGEQVFVAGNDEGGVGALGAFEDFVVVGVAAEVDLSLIHI